MTRIESVLEEFCHKPVEHGGEKCLRIKEHDGACSHRQDAEEPPLDRRLLILEYATETPYVCVNLVSAPILSVLIPCVPSRREQAWALFDKLSAQAEGLDVEVLLLLDNKTRTAGKKREALVQASRGEYVAFVDDDDDVAEDYVSAILAALDDDDPDVIVFNSQATINSAPPVLCLHDLTFPNEQYNPAGFRRAPWQMHAWRGDLARATPFPDVSNAEDWPWCEAMLKHVKTQAKIDRVLYHYRYDDAKTEASK